MHSDFGSRSDKNNTQFTKTYTYESDVLLLVVVIIGAVFCGIRAEDEEIFDGRNSGGM